MTYKFENWWDMSVVVQAVATKKLHNRFTHAMEMLDKQSKRSSEHTGTYKNQQFILELENRLKKDRKMSVEFPQLSTKRAHKRTMNAVKRLSTSKAIQQIPNNRLRSERLKSMAVANIATRLQRKSFEVGKGNPLGNRVSGKNIKARIQFNNRPTRTFYNTKLKKNNNNNNNNKNNGNGAAKKMNVKKGNQVKMDISETKLNSELKSYMSGV
ncbi:hypothetical protein SNEBB_007454 [Seison nebaliae]|nr:hypothetical protein SNEBB_007454 [Seison nebaliae]